MKKIILLLIITSIIYGCTEDNAENFNKEKDYSAMLSSLTNTTFTSDGKYFAEANTGFDVISGIDTVFYFEIEMYETNSVFQENYTSMEECDENSMELCEEEELVLNFGDFKLLRKYKVIEELAKYFIDFSRTYGAISGDMKWIETQKDTTLHIFYPGSNLELKVFDQKNYYK